MSKNFVSRKFSMVSHMSIEETLTKSNTLSDTNKNSATQETTNVVIRSKALQESRDDNKHAANTHTDFTSKIIGNGSSEEETSNNGSDRVDGGDRTDKIAARVIEPCFPVCRSLDRVENRGVIAV